MNPCPTYRRSPYQALKESNRRLKAENRALRNALAKASRPVEFKSFTARRFA